MISYLSFQMRMRSLTRNVSRHSSQSNIRSIKDGIIARCNFVMNDEILLQYVEGFDNVLASIGWNERKLLSEIDQNWEY